MSAHRFLCLFSSASLRDASFFARLEGHWHTDLDQGPCEFVPLVVDEEIAALASCGLFTAATVLCGPADLGTPLAAALRSGSEAFERAALPVEVVAADAPVTVLGWLAENVPGLVGRCRVDGEVRPESPSWWRDRARLHLAPAEATPAAAGPEDLAGELRAFVARRGW